MPNNNRLGFVAKVWDDTYEATDADGKTTKGAYVPIYVAPDATDKVRGDVKLSDKMDPTTKAADGMTAATPNAIYTTLRYNVDVKSATSSSAKFSASYSNDTNNITYTLPAINAKSIVGTLDASVIPASAKEVVRIVGTLSDMKSLTSSTVQAGDTIKVTETDKMYYVVDPAVTNDGIEANTSGVITGTDGKFYFLEYSAGSATSAKTAESATTAAKANSAAKLTTARTISLTNNVTGSVSFDGSKNVSLSTTIADEAVTNAKLGGLSISSGKIQDNAVIERTIKDANVTTSKIKDANVTKDKLAANSVVESKIANGSVTTDKIGSRAVTSAKIALDSVTGGTAAGKGNLGAATVQEYNMANGAITTSKIKSGNVTGDKIASETINLTKFADNCGGIYYGTPTSKHAYIAIW